LRTACVPSFDPRGCASTNPRLLVTLLAKCAEGFVVYGRGVARDAHPPKYGLGYLCLLGVIGVASPAADDRARLDLVVLEGIGRGFVAVNLRNVACCAPTGSRAWSSWAASARDPARSPDGL